MNHEEALLTILRRLNAQHDTLNFLCREIASMSETFSTALTNLSAADASLKAEVAAAASAIGSLTAQVSSLTGSLSTSQAPTADQIAAIQSVADDANAAVATLTGAVTPPAPPSTTGTTTAAP